MAYAIKNYRMPSVNCYVRSVVDPTQTVNLITDADGLASINEVELAIELVAKCGFVWVNGPPAAEAFIGEAKNVTAAGAYAVLGTDCDLFFDTTNGAQTCTLPAAGATVRRVYVKKIDAGAGTVTISGNGALIDGAATLVLTAQNQAVRLARGISSQNWRVSEGYGTPAVASLDAGGNKITNVAAGTVDTDGVNLAQLNAAGKNFDAKNSVRLATNAALPAYTRTANVLLADANGALPDIDGVAPVVGNSVLLRNGAAGADNGIYVIDSLGSGGTPWQMTRRSDCAVSSSVTSGLFVEVEEGTAWTGTAWLLVSANPIVLNTTALVFSQWNGLVNRTDGVVAPVGTQSAGTSPKVAAADHVHAHGNQLGGALHADAVAAGTAGFMTGADKTKLDGVEALADVTDATNVAAAGAQMGTGYFGDGSDGAALFENAGTTAGCTYVAPTVARLDRDVFYTTVQVNAGITVYTNGFRLHAKGVLNNDGTVHNDGFAGDDGVAPAAGGAAGSLAGGGAGGADKAGAGAGNNGTDKTASLGGSAGAGGNDDGVPTNAGGTAGAATDPGVTTGNARSLPSAATGQLVGVAGLTALNGGAGGGSGGAAAGSTGGAGGGGGGIVMLVARRIVNTATGVIRSKGGNGKVGAGAAGGGGAGGGGGIVLFVCNSYSDAGSISVAAGTAANGAGTGTAGADGAVGTIIQVVQN